MQPISSPSNSVFNVTIILMGFSLVLLLILPQYELAEPITAVGGVQYMSPLRASRSCAGPSVTTNAEQVTSGVESSSEVGRSTVV